VDLTAAVAPAHSRRRSNFWYQVRYWLSDWKMALGLALILALILFALIGSLFVSYNDTTIAIGPYNAAPSAQYPLGTDNVGRSIFALMVFGILPTLEIGFIAGGVGIVVGTILGLTTGYFGGLWDTIVRSIADVTLAVPSLVFLVVLAAYFRTQTIELTALIVAMFAWAGPTRAIRSQALSMRELPFIRVARISGRTELEIILLEIMPNLLPYLAAGLVGSVAGGILAAVGIQLLGLGPLFTPNLGMILQFAMNGSALYQNMWWWWGPPVLALLMLFLGLFLVSLTLDEMANPRLRERV
jgi:peptide/nickel transport system permease protein